MAQHVTYAWEIAPHAIRNIHCTWSCQNVAVVADSTQYSVADLLVEVKGHDAEAPLAEQSEHISRHKHPKLHGLLDAVLGSGSDTSNFAVPVKVLLPSVDGYPIQENIIRDRFTDSEVISSVHRLADWTAKTKAALQKTLTGEGLVDVVESGAAALIGHKTPPSEDTEERRQIEHELHCRLQLQWWQSELPPLKRLGLVMVGRTWRFYAPVYEAARANRINLVIIDEPDHWLNESWNSELCERFLPLSLNNDDGQLPDRIVELVRDSGLALDGLTCHNDQRIAAVAEAAAMLGLPTQPASSYLLCRDKHATHRLRPNGLLSRLVTTMEQASALAEDSTVEYPLVVKPRSGWHSDGVVKVPEPAELLPAIMNILSELHDTAVIETYIDGPEIDVNLVLSNGRILFCEVADNAPGAGDDDTADISAGLQARGFAETVTASPSALPQEELSMARDAAFQAVMAAGFNSGSFHVEGRLMNSSVRYERVGGGMELRPHPHPPRRDASFVLIEINARPPGLPVTVAAKRTFGVDYYAQLMFMALNEHERMHVLSQPYAFPGLRGAQYWTHTQFPLVPIGGMFDGSAWMSMIASHPQAFQNVSIVDSIWEHGQEIPDPTTGRPRALGYLVMYARESRRRLEVVVADVLGQLQPTLAAGLIRTVKERASSDSGSGEL